MESLMTKHLRIRKPIVREALAEFLGTFILIVLGDGSVAQYVYGEKHTYPKNFLVINLAWGFSVTMGVHVAGGVSGAHLNPAVSLAFAVIGRFPWWKVPIYFLAQYLGAFVGAGVVAGVYYEAQRDFESGFSVPGTAGIYSTFPKDYLSAGNGLGDQISSTALLVLLIMAIVDEKNKAAPKGMQPLLIGFIVTVIGMSFGLNCGYAINPARDLGPRILTAVAGWGVAPFTFRNYNWFWVPIVGPYIGGIVGAIIYLLFISIHHEDEEKEEPAQTKDAIGSNGSEELGQELGGRVNNAYDIQESSLNDKSRL